MAIGTDDPPGADTSITSEIDALIATNLLYWKLEEQFAANAEPPLLSKQERHVLLRLEQPRRMGVLAAEMQILPSTLTILAAALETAGLIVKLRDPQDGRAQVLQLTEQGAAVRIATIARGARVFAEVTGLTEAEISTFATLARKYKAHILRDGIPKGLTP